MFLPTVEGTLSGSEGSRHDPGRLSCLLVVMFLPSQVSVVGFLFLLGLYISSLASCMGGLYGAPRVLQCIAQERVIPALAVLANGVRIERFTFSAFGRRLYTPSDLDSSNNQRN